MNIVVLDGYTLNPNGDNPWDPIAALGSLTVHDRTPNALVVDRASGADVLLTNKTEISADAIARLPRLGFISILATGFNVVDIDAARRRKIPVSNVPVYGTNAVAQHVFACVLNLLNQPQLHDQAIREGNWQQQGDFCFWLLPITELAGKTMGIVGMGRIGAAVAKLAAAFDMRVIATDPNHHRATDLPDFKWCRIEDLFAQSDVISLHCPLNKDNLQFVNRGLLHRMKSTAILVNTARGGLVNEEDLANALNRDTIKGACIDVVSEEPISEDNPLFRAKNCLLTPHIAWAAVEARRRLMQATAENIAAFQQGRPINVVN